MSILEKVEVVKLTSTVQRKAIFLMELIYFMHTNMINPKKVHRGE